MATKIHDLVGQRFGRLTVIEQAGINKYKKALFSCICDCGKCCEVIGSKLVSGHTKSCGCLQKEKASKRMTTHGNSMTRLAGIWYGMRKRCGDPNSKEYGGRGIKICDEWLNSFQAFYEWAMENGYSNDLTIDRIDVNGDYCPENCRWATRQTQSNNTRANHYITYNGETRTLSEWAKHTGLKYSTLRSRINLYKWDAEKALSFPVKVKGA